MSSITQFRDSAIVPTLVDYIRIPAKSPHFDKSQLGGLALFAIRE